MYSKACLLSSLLFLAHLSTPLPTAPLAERQATTIGQLQNAYDTAAQKIAELNEEITNLQQTNSNPTEISVLQDQINIQKAQEQTLQAQIAQLANLESTSYNDADHQTSNSWASENQGTAPQKRQDSIASTLASLSEQELIASAEQEATSSQLNSNALKANSEVAKAAIAKRQDSVGSIAQSMQENQQAETQQQAESSISSMTQSQTPPQSGVAGMGDALGVGIAQGEGSQGEGWKQGEGSPGEGWKQGEGGKQGEGWNKRAAQDDETAAYMDSQEQMFEQEMKAQNEMQAQTTEEEFAQKMNDAAWKTASSAASDKIQ